MAKKILFPFWLLLIVGMITMVFNSCGKDNKKPNNPGTIAITGISLDKPTLTLNVGAESTLIATVSPDNAPDKTVTWTSSDESKATVVNGKVTAKAAGTVTITAKAGDKTTTCALTIAVTTDPGVVISGVKWATRNLDAPGTFAAASTDAGKFYQWNRKIAWPSTGSVTGWDSSTPTGDTWIKDNDPSPFGWRVPTNDEIKTLLDTNKVTNEWTTVNGVTGREFTDKASGNSLFLPAAGNRYNDDGTLYYTGTSGYYWSSSTPDSISAYMLIFGYGSAAWSGSSRSTGFSVRCVAE